MNRPDKDGWWWAELIDLGNVDGVDKFIAIQVNACKDNSGFACCVPCPHTHPGLWWRRVEETDGKVIWHGRIINPGEIANNTAQ